MAEPVIRAAEPADGEELRALFRRSSLSNAGDRESLLAHEDVLVLDDLPGRRVAVVDGRIAGFATLLVDQGRGELEDLFVDPDLMRSGIGRALVLDAVALARARGLRRIEVTANGHALGFYEKAGFVLDETIETRFGPGYRMHLDVLP